MNAHKRSTATAMKTRSGVEQPAGDGADDAGDAVRLLGHAGRRPPGLSREDHHCPRPVDADGVDWPMSRCAMSILVR
jgi:hypothetical protein